MSTKLTTNVDQRRLRTTKFPPEFNTKVDMRKVEKLIINKWIRDELTTVLKGEDDVVEELVLNIMNGSNFPNIKELQVQLSGFLDKDAPSFCLTLWKLCISAQNDPEGIPRELVEAKKGELLREREEAEQAREAAIARQNEERERERERDRIRDRERNDRRDRGRGGGGARFGRDSDRWQRRDSRSPPRRRRRDDDDFSRPTRGADTWAPSSRRDDRAPRRRRSPSYSRSPSRSRSPPRRRRRNSSPSPSRSPPRRRRRNTSSARSSSGEPSRRENGRDRSRSAGRRSPRPSKRARRTSPSPARPQQDGAADSRPGSSSSGTSVSKGKVTNGAGSKDLLSKTNGGKDGRLSQEPKEVGSDSA